MVHAMCVTVHSVCVQGEGDLVVFQIDFHCSVLSLCLTINKETDYSES